MNRIVVDQLTKAYGRQVVLNSVCCEFASGQLSLLMGHNGAGKSTLLQLIGTILAPTEGILSYKAADQQTFSEKKFSDEQRHQLGYLAHSPWLYRDMTPLENLTIFADLYGVDNAAQQVMQWIDRLQLQAYGNTPVRQLSRGTVQRVALARALIHQPSVLLLDEPFTGLDSTSCAILRQELMRQRERGCIIIIVSHDTAELDGITDHLLILDNGRLVTDVSSPNMTAEMIERIYTTRPATTRPATHHALHEGIKQDPTPVVAAQSTGETPAATPTTETSGQLRAFKRLVIKDLQLEWRSKEILATSALLAVLMVVIFSFAFGRDEQPSTDVIGGILWSAISFTGILSIGRLFGRERESDTLTAIRLCPVSRGYLYLSKLIGALVYMGITELVTVPLILILFDATPIATGTWVCILIVGTLGFAAVGVLFAAPLGRQSQRDMLLAILTYPVVMPALVASTRATSLLMRRSNDLAGATAEIAAATQWLHLLIAFDALFIVLSMWAFSALLADDG